MDTEKPLSELEAILLQAQQVPLVDSFTAVAGRFGGNVALLARVQTRFMPEVDSQMHNLNKGLNHANSADIKSALHTLKGVTSTVGAARLSFVFAQLELGVKEEGGASLVVELLSEENRALLQALIAESNAVIGTLYADNGVA